MRSRARGYLSELRRDTCPEEFHSSFCFPFSPAEFLATPSNLSSPTATGPDKVAYPILKHLPRSGMDFLLHIFNLSWTSHPFLPSGIHLLLFQFTRWENLSTLLLPSGLSLSPPAYQSFLNASIYPVYSSFWNLIPFSLPARSVSVMGGLLQIKFCAFLSLFQDGFNKPRPGSRTILSTIDFSKAFESIWHPVLFHKLNLVDLPSSFARWTQSFLSDRRACVVYQNHKIRSFRVRQGVLQESVLFSLFINDLPASLPSSVICSFYADDLVI